MATFASHVDRSDAQLVSQSEQLDAPDIPGTPVEQLAMPTLEDGYYEQLDVFDDGKSIGYGKGSVASGCSLYGSADLLLWWTHGMDLPPLVTTSPTGTPDDEIGVLGEPDTTVLFGDGLGLDDGGQLGGRFTIGNVFADHAFGLEASYTFLESQSTAFQVASPGTAIIARPFRNTTIGAQDAVNIAIPGELEGDVAINTSIDYQHFDLRMRKFLVCQDCLSVDFLAGYRYANLDERLRIADTITTLVAFPPAAPVIPTGTTLAGVDQFDTDNQFNGGQIGFVCEVVRNGWSAELLLNVALGSTRSRVAINGVTNITVPGTATATEPGSKLALPSNIGQFERDSFSVMPELAVRLNYDLSPCWRASLAYDFVYWSHVTRPGNQIDLNIDENQFPLPNLAAGTGISPEFQFDFEDFWAQGLSLSLSREF